MNKTDKKKTIVRYTERYKKHGYSPLSLGWGKNGKQSIRFKAMKEIGIRQASSVLDIGCGFADFYKYLKESGWDGRYTGTDLAASLLKEAEKQNQGIDVRQIDILTEPFEDRFDFVVASGIFNAPLSGEDNYNYIEIMLKKMFSLARIGVAVDFLSIFVDYQETCHFHSDPMTIFNFAKSLTRRAALRHDYMPFEFMVYLYADDTFSGDNLIFNPLKTD